MHLSVALHSVSDVTHRGHFSVVLQQDGVVGHIGVTMSARQHGVLVHVDAVGVKLHGHVQMSGSIGGAWHKQSPRNELQHKSAVRDTCSALGTDKRLYG